MRRITLTLASATAVLLTTATAFAGQPTNTTASAEDSNPMAANIAILDVDGNQIGTVRLRQGDNKVRVRAVPVKSTPGFHGFHIHDVGLCEPDAPDGPFTTALGHYEGAVDTNHGDHAGDMPSLLVKANGRSQLSFRTDRFTLAELRAGNGSAVMVHAARDNFANIPVRYEVGGVGGPDATTLATGDAGARIGCGVID